MKTPDKTCIKAYENNVSNSEYGILFIHGIIGTAMHFKEFFPLATDYSVRSILLDGHGGNALDFAHTSMDKWHRQVNKEIEKLLENHKKIIIVAHSMGTLFAIRSSIDFSQHIAGIFLWDVPVKIHLKAKLIKNCWKVFTNRIKENDIEAQAARNAYGIELDYKIWRYLGWIPRYLELFREIKNVVPMIKNINVPTVIFQSKLDEMVSTKSIDILNKIAQDNSNIKLDVLENSTHFYYPENDMKNLFNEFSKFLNSITK